MGGEARQLSILGAPTSAGSYAPGQEDAPGALRDCGLLERLREGGAGVLDTGDTPRWRWRPDHTRRDAQNVGAVIESATAVAARVRGELTAQRLPVVLGGDCTIELGTLSGAIAAGHDPALVYFDLHPDLNIPTSVADGAPDRMGMAHMLDIPGAVDELAGCGPRRPLIPAAHVFLYSHDPSHSTEHESEITKHLASQGIRMDAVAGEPASRGR